MKTSSIYHAPRVDPLQDGISVAGHEPARRASFAASAAAAALAPCASVAPTPQACALRRCRAIVSQAPTPLASATAGPSSPDGGAAAVCCAAPCGGGKASASAVSSSSVSASQASATLVPSSPTVAAAQCAGALRRCRAKLPSGWQRRRSAMRHRAMQQGAHLEKLEQSSHSRRT